MLVSQLGVMMKGTTATEDFLHTDATVHRHGSAPVDTCMVTMQPGKTMFPW